MNVQNAAPQTAKQSSEVPKPLQSAAVLASLESVTPRLYSSLEKAITTSREWFLEEKVPVDAFLFPNLVRYFALRFLESAPLEVDGLVVTRLANNGIYLRFGEYQIRVWKADEGELPAPGDSRTKTEFYEQPDLWEGMRFLKLAVIWDVTSTGTLQKLLLVCPRGDENPFKTGQCHWQIEIPHPVTTVSSANATDDSYDVPLPNAGATKANG